MMRLTMKAAILAIALMISLAPVISCAQEAKPAAAPEVKAEEMEYSYGEVKSVSKDELVVSEYDYEKDEYTSVAYAIDPAVKLDNVKSLTEIAAGDTVDIDYVVKDGKNIAKIIAVEKQPVE